MPGHPGAMVMLLPYGPAPGHDARGPAPAQDIYGIRLSASASRPTGSTGSCPGVSLRLQQTPTQFTARTITDPARLRGELGDCRRTDTAAVREEMTPHADSVATRIMAADGCVVVALSVVVRSGSVALRTVILPVVASGLGISRRLGWTPEVGVRGQSSPRVAVVGPH